ncbi:LysE/ArgO family amino acid transporter [Thorsellia anophelis]|uniref:L-lysine exporter family protein LysE/ArgO n=1 Tax=Thorsellia anophelis DSM 18579 TaxID=1123402 RepID=A0A1H9ZAK5_9GAMM|nr:LysE/ArgO family amino acid transporter [Thorsellia anophelis]SES77877.1 L-lysine exporter family protein LysE/ArgO [Thorsellia anophelis DSM 18579]
MISIVLQGFLLGLSLIVAIGSQNAFILRQGLIGRHVFALTFFCALADALLITIGVSGFYLVVQQYPIVIDIARFAGAAFITTYGILRLISAYKGTGILDSANAKETQSLKVALLSCAAFTFLNPHVYLDTVILLGSIAAQFGQYAWLFGLGACIASFSFFFSLGYGARFLRPLFEKKRSWQILDLIIGIMMLMISINLLFFFNV